jgi:hypothetical protein
MQKGIVGLIFIIAATQLRVTIALTCFMYVSYVVGDERAINFFSAYRIYSVSTDTILMSIYEV